MGKQVTFRGFMKPKYLRVEKFLDTMEKIVPWDKICHEITPYYRSGDGGRPAYPLIMMLKIHFLQQWNNLSDPAMEEAIYDRLSFQKFLGFDIFGGVIPDQSSILRFRHLLEKHQLSNKILQTVNRHLNEHNLVLNDGTIVDATLMQAPVSKKNKAKLRDPEMTSTKKNNKWYFGGKGHLSVQSQGKPIIHSTHFSTAKDGDKPHMTKLFHGKERAIFGYSAYGKQEEKRGARNENLYYGISDKGVRGHRLSSSQKKRNRKHSTIRAKVEHPFRIIKELWGHRKLRYKGLAKNGSQFTILCALTNLYFCRKNLLATG